MLQQHGIVYGVCWCRLHFRSVRVAATQGRIQKARPGPRVGWERGFEALKASRKWRRLTAPCYLQLCCATRRRTNCSVAWLRLKNTIFSVFRLHITSVSRYTLTYGWRWRKSSKWYDSNHPTTFIRFASDVHCVRIKGGPQNKFAIIEQKR